MLGLLLLFCLDAGAQNKFIRTMDTLADGNPLLEKSEICSGSTELDPYAIDYDLVNCLLVQEINAYRKKKHLHELQYDLRLDQLAQNYLNYFHRSAFIANFDNKVRINRPIKKASKKLNYKKGFVNAIIYQAELVPLAKHLFFYYADGENGPLNLYYGTRPEKEVLEGGQYVFNPVKLATYSVFVKQFFKTKILRTYQKAINDKAMRYIGCRCRVIEQSLYKQAMPSANFMIIIGGNRLELLPQPQQ